MSSKPRLIAIVGPTASGKTAWAIRLAQTLNGELISADSRQVYRQMDIGTAKDTSYPQHLIDIINPDETMTVAAYKEQAVALINEIAQRGKTPILVGGTAQYVYAVIDNWEIPSVPPQAEIRRGLEVKTLEELQSELKTKDPEAFAVVDLKNKRRVVRALEVAITTGESFLKQRTKGQPLFDTLLIGISVPREELNHRIDARVDAMMAAGLESEVRSLAAKYGWDAPAMNGIGYRQFKAYTEGTETLDQAVAHLKHDTHDVAKRQMTWFRRDERIHWCEEFDQADVLVKEFTNNKI